MIWSTLQVAYITICVMAIIMVMCRRGISGSTHEVIMFVPGLYAVNLLYNEVSMRIRT